jgi:hypothetical protein
MALGLRKQPRIISFTFFFSYSFDIWYIALPYLDTSIKFEFGSGPLIFHDVMALGLTKKNHELSVFRTFFALLTDIHLIFGTSFCHTKLQIKFKFGFLSI